MKIVKQFLLSIFAILAFSVNAAAQVEMADSMRADGKIYVVVSIILIILIGLFLYLFLLDRKIKKLENQFHERQRQTK